MTLTFVHEVELMTDRTALGAFSLTVACLTCGWAESGFRNLDDAQYCADEHAEAATPDPEADE